MANLALEEEKASSCITEEADPETFEELADYSSEDICLQSDTKMEQQPEHREMNTQELCNNLFGSCLFHIEEQGAKIQQKLPSTLKQVTIEEICTVLSSASINESEPEEYIESIPDSKKKKKEEEPKEMMNTNELCKHLFSSCIFHNEQMDTKANQKLVRSKTISTKELRVMLSESSIDEPMRIVAQELDEPVEKLLCNLMSDARINDNKQNEVSKFIRTLNSINEEELCLRFSHSTIADNIEHETVEDSISNSNSECSHQQLIRFTKDNQNGSIRIIQGQVKRCINRTQVEPPLKRCCF